MSNPFPSESTPNQPADPVNVPAAGEAVMSNEATDAAEQKRKKRNRKIAFGVGGVIAGVGVLAAGTSIVGNIMRGPSNPDNGPNPIDTPTSEATPSPEATAGKYEFDATSLDIPANATDEQLEQGTVNIADAIITGSLDGNLDGKLSAQFSAEYDNRDDFGISMPDFATQKATETIDAIFDRQFVKNWASIDSLRDLHDRMIKQLGLRIQAYYVTSSNPAGMMYSEEYSLDGPAKVSAGGSPDKKVVTIAIMNTNNAEAIGLKQSDNSLANLNGMHETIVYTYVVVNGRQLVADSFSYIQ